MDEIWSRLTLIAGALGVALLVALSLRSRASRSSRRFETTGLAGGVYLFTSSACLDCRPARDALAESLGDEFVEIAWERDPVLFQQLDVSEVPATLLVEADGSGTLFPGQPDKALSQLGP
jgi:hypothetical protein